LIGVIAKTEQLGTVEEFFELFKTPWEFYRAGQAYDVIVATADEVPQVSARLLVLYGPAAKGIDPKLGVVPLARNHDAVLSDRDGSVPIYGDLLTFGDGGKGNCCLRAREEIAGVRVSQSGLTLIRLGYDLFDEVKFLLSEGQPVEHAHIPTLDIHIRMLRNWILSEGIPLLEIPPAPAGYAFAVCLTHDIDFIGIRNHKFDHTMWGFVYRSTIAAVQNLFRRRISMTRLLESWRAAASLPFVYLGWARDFWEPFGWYLSAEKNTPATYFLIPFKKRSGENAPGPHPSWRAAAYEIGDLPQWTATLLSQGCEIGVHGIDSWHSADKGREELGRVAAATGCSSIGTRVHWLLRDANTFSALEQAGYAYDSTCGYNETVGYRAGTGQVFCPLGAQTLLELPLHVQDGALFFPDRLNLLEPEAEQRCRALMDNANKMGGVLTVLWHDRSHGPERFWGEFYVRLLQALRSRDVWFGTAGQVVGWFRKRREVRFERVEAQGVARIQLRYQGEKIHPPLRVRVYAPRPKNDRKSHEAASAEVTDVSWNGEPTSKPEIKVASSLAPSLPELALSSFL